MLDAVEAPGRPDRAQRARRIRASQSGSCDTTALRAAGPRRRRSWRDHLHAGSTRRHRHRVLAGPVARGGHRTAPLGGRTGNVAIWRVDAPDEPMLLDLPDAGSNPGAPNWANAFGRVRFSPDGSRLYASGFGPTAIFDTRTGALVGELEGEGILAVSPDGGSVLVRDGRTAVRIVDLDGSDRSRACWRCRPSSSTVRSARTARTSPRPAETAIWLWSGATRGCSRSRWTGMPARSSPWRSARTANW